MEHKWLNEMVMLLFPFNLIILCILSLRMFTFIERMIFYCASSEEEALLKRFG